jgi:Holliday junction DNA helicase RuvA
VISTAKLGETISLNTALVVREESLTLFGFSNGDSRELFELIQGVSGFGPRLAFTVLSFLSADQLRVAIATGDVARLTKTPGVGAKGASRLILELKDRIGHTASVQTSQATWEHQVEQALIGLGWSAKDAASAITTLKAEHGLNDPTVPEMLKQALQLLGRTK